MKLSALLQMAGMAMLTVACSSPEHRSPMGVTVAIVDVTVIDATGAPPMEHRTVLLAGARIAAIGAAGAGPPAGAVLVDGRGKFLIPGLWDMHAHTFWAENQPLYVANGVTGTRALWGSVEDYERRRQRVEGITTVPRQYIGTPLVDGPVPVWPGSIALQSVAEAERLVDLAPRSGAHFIKVYQKLPRDIYFALARAAQRKNVEFSGHVPSGISWAEASDAGQRTLEHLGNVLFDLSSEAAELRVRDEALKKQLVTGKAMTPAQQAQSRDLLRRALATQRDDLAQGLVHKLAANGTWLCPTIIVEWTLARLDDSVWSRDARLAYMTPWFGRVWDPRNDFRLSARTAEDWELQRQHVDAKIRLVGEMYRGGVRILAGSDTPNPYVFPGFGLHDELSQLVGAGLPPMSALQAATRNAAEYMNRRDLGTIEAGKLADLVLLDADPLQDIANTRKIAAVVIGGRVLRRAQLDDMLAGVRAAVARPQVAEALAPVLKEKGLAAALARLEALQQAEPQRYDYSFAGVRSFGDDVSATKRDNDMLAWLEWLGSRFPKEARVQVWLGDHHRKLGNVEQARRAYVRALELAPGDFETLYRIETLPARPGT